MLAFGIDPGFAYLGLAVVELGSARTRVVHHETFRTKPKDADAHRLDAIADRLFEVFERFDPVIMGYENQAGVEVAMQRRPADDRDGGTNYSSRRVHEVSGIIRATSRFYAVPCYCQGPSTVKVALLGRGGGHAKKARVQEAVRRLFAIEADQHAADAIATAICAGQAHRKHLVQLRSHAHLIPLTTSGARCTVGR